MAIIKDSGIKCLGQFDGVIVYIKSAINKMFIDGEKKEVVTGICFKDLDGNVLYEQNNYNSYICLLESDSNFFNLNDIIEELALYVQHCDTEKYYKDMDALITDDLKLDVLEVIDISNKIGAKVILAHPIEIMEQ